MFKIGEFSRLTRVSARMLRHYEKCGLIDPAEIDRFTGYRFYSAGQIPLMNRIVMLRDAGFSIDEIGEVLAHGEDARFVREAIERKRAEIEAAVALERDKLRNLARLADVMKGEAMGMIYEVELKRLPAVNVLATRGVLAAYDREGELWQKLGAYMGRHGIACEAGGYSIYLDEEYKDADALVEVAVPVGRMGESDGDFAYKTLPEIGLAATVRFKGPHNQYAAATEKLGRWMEQNGYAFAGPLRGQAIVSPGDQPDPADFLTELQVPIEQR